MNTDLPSAPILTDRLSLRLFEASDFEAYAAYHSRAEVYRFLYTPVPSGRVLEDQFSAVLSAPFNEDGDTLRLAVTRLEEPAVIGEALLKIANKAALQAEMGYIFNPDYAGKGYATEAVQAVLRLGFQTYGFHRIFARLDPLNAGSVGVVERLKMRREAHLLQNDRFDGNWGDEFIYAMLASEFEARQSRTI
ncbi:GNAT family protein [uncultured Nitratireductor sp.]|uniref:GNAT family N-acetyltransferase n=1 Tax=uncultured Nitratireductor sp. TaxID=520953 RepID=UPI0025EE9FA7|nr:GNAT family protein [uncultured Nitratireductor sp.]